MGPGRSRGIKPGQSQLTGRSVSSGWGGWLWADASQGARAGLGRGNSATLALRIVPREAGDVCAWAGRLASAKRGPQGLVPAAVCGHLSGFG